MAKTTGGAVRVKAVKRVQENILARSTRLRELRAEVFRMQEIRCRYLYSRHECETWRRVQVQEMATALQDYATKEISDLRFKALFTADRRVASVRAINKKQRERQARQAPVDELSLPTAAGRVLRMVEQRRAEAREAARERIGSHVETAYVRCGYRKAQGRWVGGGNFVRAEVGEPGVRATISTVWHKRHTWKGSDLSVTLRVRESWLEAVEAQGLAVIENRLTLDVEPIEANEGEQAHKACWVEQSRGLELRTERGVLYRRQSRKGGAWLPWVHATTLTGARQVYARMLRAAQGAA